MKLSRSIPSMVQLEVIIFFCHIYSNSISIIKQQKFCEVIKNKATNVEIVYQLEML